jgi:dihydrofolate reductase
MDLIVAVYDDWGIGADGDQPIALSADRKFFRETTKGSTVIVGRKTLAAFPGGRPLPNRVNLVLTRQDVQIPGVTVCHSVEEAAKACENAAHTFVIGGGTVYRQMLPLCDRAYITKVHVTPASDTFFPNLDEDPEWDCAEILQAGEENGIRYEMCLYRRK